MNELSARQEIYLLYKVTNAVNGKAYIGVTKQKLMRRWKAHIANGKRISNTALGRALKKYGAEHFTIEVVTEAYSGREAIAAERGLIAEHGTLVPTGYNLTIGGEKTVGYSFSRTTREKMGNSRRGRVHSEEAKKKIGNAHRGSKRTPEQRRHMSCVAKALGRRFILSEAQKEKLIIALRSRAPVSPETRAKIGAKSKGRICSEEARARMSASQLGRKHSEETKEKIRRASLKFRHTEETKKRLSEIRRAYYATKKAEPVNA